MANRVLLLLTLASRSDSNISSKMQAETAGKFYFQLIRTIMLLLFQYLSFPLHFN